MVFTTGQTIATVVLGLTMQSGIVAAIEPTRVNNAWVITDDFESTIEKPLELKVNKLLAMKGDEPSAMKRDKPSAIKGLVYFKADSAADNSDNPSGDAEAAAGDPVDLRTDFYNQLYSLFAGRDHGDWSALLSNMPIASQPSAHRPSVDTPAANRDSDTLVVDTASGTETAEDPSDQLADDEDAVESELSTPSDTDNNLPTAHRTGEFRIAKTIIIDSDTNDPQRAYQSNDKRLFAQAAVNPGMVIGYMNTRKKGPEGRSKANGDKRDIYRIDALGGEVINLIINDPSQADLDLYLQNAEGETLMTSVGSSPFESLQLPNRVASYYLTIQFYGVGASGYSLSIGVDAEEMRGNGPQDNDYAVDQSAARKLSSSAHSSHPSDGGYQPASDSPNDSQYADQWHLSKMRVKQAWQLTTGSPDVIVAVIDTGVVAEHKDLIARLSADSYDFVSDIDNSGDGDGYDRDASDPGNGRDNPWCFDSGLEISNFHGTHVAGIIAAETNNYYGTSGITQHGQIMNLRALGCVGGNALDIANAVRYAAGLENDAGVLPRKKADIINLSLSSTGDSRILKAAIQAARAEGVIVIAAAGNSASSQAYYPVSYDGVIGVSAVNGQDELADFSNFGSAIDITAPGGKFIRSDGQSAAILSTQAKITNGIVVPGFGSLTGTSMASAQVAGVVALMKGVYPALNSDSLLRVINTGEITEDLGAAGRDYQFGNGRIDAQRAVEYALRLESGMPIPTQPILDVNASYINLSALKTQFTLRLSNAGDGELVILSVTSESEYIGIDRSASDQDYQITINRTGLDLGVYTESVTVSSNAGVFKIPVVFEVVASEVLMDADIGTLIMQARYAGRAIGEDYRLSADSNNAYAYALDSEVVYDQIVAGVDLDNDGEVCNDSEACITFPIAADATSADGDGRGNFKVTTMALVK